ncbi:MAG: glycosyltransferase, partial [Acinetobacter sp.]|nr:glycosyltransferase [Acinetobacter sp.]
SIGRESLLRTIKSVQQQTYPCTHYIFVDGPQYHQQVLEMVKDYPNVKVSYLGMNTGAGGMCNSIINAVAPFLVTEDIICFIDDDNWMSADHVHYLVDAISRHNADYAYNLRYYVDETEQILCPDNVDSTGFWHHDQLHYKIRLDLFGGDQEIDLHSRFRPGHLIDTNSYGIKREVALKLALTWIQRGDANDVAVTQALLKANMKGVNTGKRTIYYMIDVERREILSDDFFQSCYPNHELDGEQKLYTKYQMVKQRNFYAAKRHDIVPWEQEVVFEHGELKVIEE